jgi:uncharacterized protein
LISFDTNIALAMVDTGHPSHSKGALFSEQLRGRPDVVVSEFMLLELYVLLRDPAAVRFALGAEPAMEACRDFRTNPAWQVVALPPDFAAFHEELWTRLRSHEVARRRAYDLRLGLSLRYFGVDEFATANLRDFQDVGFARVWNPLVEN